MLNVDASIKGLRVVIMQEEKPVASGSKTVTTYEGRNAYNERDKERVLLPIVWGAQKFLTMCMGAE